MTESFEAREELENRISAIRRKDRRFSRNAYNFVLDAVDYTLEKKYGSNEEGHINGREIAEGFRDLAYESFGPLANLVMQRWGVKRTEHIGEIVWSLKDFEILIPDSDHDSRLDFADLYDFQVAFKY